MAKWYGKIGYSVTENKGGGIWESTITEKSHYGEMTGLRRSNQNSGGVNDDIIIKNAISILADPFAMDNFCNMVYVEIFGSKWKITEVEVQYPRLNLTLGGVYNA